MENTKGVISIGQVLFATTSTEILLRWRSHAIFKNNNLRGILFDIVNELV